MAGSLRTYKAAAPYSLTNNEGVIRFDPVVQQHEGNVTNGATGWRRLENRERLVVNEDYSGFSLNCPGSPHYTEGGLITGQTNSTAPARHQQTPFPTGATASSSGSRVQYLFLASELSAPPFNLCAGNFTEIAFILLDDDPLTPIPGAALDLQIKIQGTLRPPFSPGSTTRSMPPRCVLPPLRASYRQDTRPSCSPHPSTGTVRTT
ncbi:MAG: hypothetical protein IPI41_15125 [Flavobacteriales bacterium]|nr:hypothetical protein [Flavobacteriales bacterium]